MSAAHRTPLIDGGGFQAFNDAHLPFAAAKQRSNFSLLSGPTARKA
jgi:hypothetical protein